MTYMSKNCTLVTENIKKKINKSVENKICYALFDKRLQIKKFTILNVFNQKYIILDNQDAPIEVLLLHFIAIRDDDHRLHIRD